MPSCKYTAVLEITSLCIAFFFFQEEFKLHFRNVSRIMDCVGCDKCRLWGKLQVRHLIGHSRQIETL